MFNHVLRRAVAQTQQQFMTKFIPKTTTPMPFATFRHHKYNTPILTSSAAFSAPGAVQLGSDTNLSPFTADSQQKAIMTQLLDKYGPDSDEVKEFALTTADLSVTDEIRMLSPCGTFFTNSIFYQIMFLRYNIEAAEEPARKHAAAYERCLIRDSDEELHFWNKVREMSQISAGFVQGIKDQDDALKREEEREQRHKEISDVEKEAQHLAKLAEDDDY